MANKYSDVILNKTALNQTGMPYNTTKDISSFQGLFVQSNEFMGGGLALGIIFSLWIISFYSFSEYASIDALKASTWVSFLASSLLSLLEIVSPSYSFLLLVVVLAMTANSYAQSR